MIFRLCNNIDQDWEFAVNALKPAFCGVFQVDNIEDYYQPIKDNLAQLWIAEDDEKRGAVITIIDKGNNGDTLQVRYLGGTHLKAWAEVMEIALTRFAQINGCKQIEAVTRKGFSKLVKSFKPSGLSLYIKVV